MTVAWLKALHIAALSVWAAGLLFLPGLIWHETGTQAGRRPEQDRPGVHLRSFARACYLAVVSPAAVIAIGSGMGLIFLREAFAGWMFLKLAAVGGLVLIHMNCGRAIRTLRHPDRRHHRLQSSILLVSAAGLIVGILWLVLAKPAVDALLFPEWLRHPRPRQLFGPQSSLDSMRPI